MFVGFKRLNVVSFLWLNMKTCLHFSFIIKSDLNCPRPTTVSMMVRVEGMDVYR